ncbi:hypothetical protein EHM92_02015 [bacterium]|nr:MAG: hypothetical protein EHM92_02015 [bacterium]
MKVGTLLVSAMMLAMTAGKPDAHAGDLGNPARALATMSHAQLENVKKSYLACLESPNEGVVQAAIGIVLQWRLISPQEDLSRLEREINDLAVNGDSPVTRLKASLASLVIDNPSLVNFDPAGCDDCGQLFDAITGAVRQMVVGQRLR